MVYFLLENSQTVPVQYTFLKLQEELYDLIKKCSPIKIFYTVFIGIPFPIILVFKKIKFSIFEN